VSGQTVHVTGSKNLNSSVVVSNGVTLKLLNNSNLNLGNSELKREGSGQIILQGSASISPDITCNLQYGGNGYFPTIQRAINYVTSGNGHVIVGSGSFNENISISNRSSVTIDGSGYPNTTVNGNVSVYNSGNFELTSITINGSVDIDHSDNSEVNMAIVNNQLTYTYSSNATLSSLKINSSNYPLSTLYSSISGSSNEFTNASTAIGCIGESNINFSSIRMCGNYPNDVSCSGIPNSNDVELYSCEFSDQTVGARIFDPYNNVDWNGSWSYCGARALCKTTSSSNGDHHSNPEEVAKKIFRNTLKDYHELYSKIKSENEKQKIDFKEYENELLQIKADFEEVVNNYPGTPVAIKALLHEVLILRSLGEKASAKNLLDSKENSKDFKAMKKEIKKFRTKFTVADKEFKKAIQDIDKLLKELETDEEIAREIYNKGKIYLYGLEDQEKADEMFRVVVDLYPTTAVASSAARYLGVELPEEDLAKENIGKKKQLLITNYPNPFNPKTVIEYQLPKQGFVSLKVFNMLGEVVETLVSKEQPAGKHSIEFDASDLSSGIYFYRIETNGKSESKKMILMK